MAGWARRRNTARTSAVCSVRGRMLKSSPKKDNTDQGGNGHDAPDRAPLPVKGPAYLIKDKKPHEEDGYSGNAIKLFHREIKGVGKQLDSQNKKQVCQAAGKRFVKDIAHKMPLHTAAVRLQRQEEGGNAYGQGSDQGQLQRQERIREAGKQAY